MESANLHHQHQLQPPQLVPSSTSPSTYNGAAAAASPNAWTQNFTLSNVRQKNETSNPPLNSLMIQELGFHWNSNNAVSITNHDQQIGKIKQELTDSSPKFSEMLNSTSSSINYEDSHLSASTDYIKDDQKYMSDLSEKLLLKTLSSGFPINGHQFSPSQIYSTSSYGSSASRGNFCQIYPSVNISNLNRSPPPISSPASFDINLQALDLLTTTSFGQACHDHSLGIYKDSDVSYNDLDCMHHSSLMPSCNPSKISSAFTTNEISEAKRPSNSLMEPKAAQVAIKKSRLESRASCPPFKVRKEKLGDRIATLQQLVAPFGKTDTASVLMEAIGYIKFLQNQVETLSVPYMKSSRNKNSRTTPADARYCKKIQGSTVEKGNDEPKKDLRSRGLCLVPLSCMSFVTSDGGSGGGGIWPPPNFGGGT